MGDSFGLQPSSVAWSLRACSTFHFLKIWFTIYVIRLRFFLFSFSLFLKCFTALLADLNDQYVSLFPPFLNFQTLTSMIGWNFHLHVFLISKMSYCITSRFNWLLLFSHFHFASFTFSNAFLQNQKVRIKIVLLAFPLSLSQMFNFLYSRFKGSP